MLGSAARCAAAAAGAGEVLLVTAALTNRVEGGRLRVHPSDGLMFRM